MWVNGEKGPTCKCGWPTNVSVSKGQMPILWCFGHSKEAGAMWPLPNEKPFNWPRLSDQEMQVLIEKGLSQHEEFEMNATATSRFAHVHKGRWGFHPCDKETFDKLKELNKFYVQAHQRAAFERWERKEPHNRKGRDGQPYLEPAINGLLFKETYSSNVNRSGWYVGTNVVQRERVNFIRLADLIAEEYKYARTPQAEEHTVRQLELSPDEIDRLLFQAQL